jgi:hypothetical protein
MPQTEPRYEEEVESQGPITGLGLEETGAIPLEEQLHQNRRRIYQLA